MNRLLLGILLGVLPLIIFIIINPIIIEQSQQVVNKFYYLKNNNILNNMVNEIPCRWFNLPAFNKYFFSIIIRDIKNISLIHRLSHNIPIIILFIGFLMSDNKVKIVVICYLCIFAIHPNKYVGYIYSVLPYMVICLCKKY